MLGLEFTLFDGMDEVTVTAEVPRVGLGGKKKQIFQNGRRGDASVQAQ